MFYVGQFLTDSIDWSTVCRHIVEYIYIYLGVKFVVVCHRVIALLAVDNVRLSSLSPSPLIGHQGLTYKPRVNTVWLAFP